MGTQMATAPGCASKPNHPQPRGGSCHGHALQAPALWPFVNRPRNNNEWVLSWCHAVVVPAVGHRPACVPAALSLPSPVLSIGMHTTTTSRCSSPLMSMASKLSHAHGILWKVTSICTGGGQVAQCVYVC